MTAQSSHQLIQKYLQGRADKRSLEKIKLLRRKDPAHSLLFNLLDPYAGQFSLNGGKTGTSTFHMIEDDLSRIAAGKVDHDCAHVFIQKIFSSRLYYERLLIKLAQIRTMDEKTIPELQYVDIKSDNRILKELGITASRQSATLSKISTAVKQWFAVPTRRIPAYAMVFVLCMVTGVSIIWFTQSKHRFNDLFVYDNQVPYEYDQTILRSADNDLWQNQRIRPIVDEFHAGLSFYSMQEYQKASAIFQPLASGTDSLKISHPLLARDLTFYTGLSELALASSQRQPLKTSDRKIHITRALYFLKQAAGIGKNMHENVNRENYFLGICFTLNDQPDSALARIEAIPSENPFYDKCTKLKQYIIR